MAAAARARPVCPRLDRDRLAVAVGARDHPLGCQGRLPAADPVSCPEPGERRAALLGALCLLRPPPGGRPTGHDLLPALPGPRPRQCGAERLGRRCHPAGHGAPRRCCPDALVPRSGLALGRRAPCGACLQLRRLHGLAHPACRPGAEPRLAADGDALPGPGAGAAIAWLWRRSRSGGGPAGARPRSGCPALRLPAGRLHGMAPPRQPSARSPRPARA